jgi:hypothetical protein
MLCVDMLSLPSPGSIPSRRPRRNHVRPGDGHPTNMRISSHSVLLQFAALLVTVSHTYTCMGDTTGLQHHCPIPAHNHHASQSSASPLAKQIASSRKRQLRKDRQRAALQAPPPPTPPHPHTQVRADRATKRKGKAARRPTLSTSMLPTPLSM